MKRQRINFKNKVSLVRILLLLALGLTVNTIQAQVTIGTGTSPDNNALLDLKENGSGTSTKGLLLPRVALTGTANAAPLSAHVAGMAVYNTATAGNVTPGYYYNDGTKWVRIANAGATGAEPWFSKTTGAGATSNTDSVYIMGRAMIGANTPATVASETSGSTAEQQNAYFTVVGGDASINDMTVGHGGGQVGLNVAVGTLSLFNNTTGFGNTSVGSGSLTLNTEGHDNTSSGVYTMYSNTTGANNTAFGSEALTGNSEGSGNTSIGSQTLYNATGSNNTALGNRAGTGDNFQMITGDNNIMIGANMGLSDVSASNQLNIGGIIFGTGLTGNETAPAGNIGIGTTTPGARLEINNGSTNGAIKIVDGTQGVGKVLTSDANGVGKWVANILPAFWSGPINASTPTGSIITVGKMSFRINLTNGGSSTMGNYLEVKSESGANQVGVFSNVVFSSQGSSGPGPAVQKTNSATIGTSFTAVPYSFQPNDDGGLSFNLFVYGDQAFYRVTLNAADGDSLGFGPQAFLLVEYFKK